MVNEAMVLTAPKPEALNEEDRKLMEGLKAKCKKEYMKAYAEFLIQNEIPFDPDKDENHWHFKYLSGIENKSDYRKRWGLKR